MLDSRNPRKYHQRKVDNMITLDNCEEWRCEMGVRQQEASNPHTTRR
jgi:hypothetical protein